MRKVSNFISIVVKPKLSMQEDTCTIVWENCLGSLFIALNSVRNSFQWLKVINVDSKRLFLVFKFEFCLPTFNFIVRTLFWLGRSLPQFMEGGKKKSPQVFCLFVINMTNDELLPGRLWIRVWLL